MLKYISKRIIYLIPVLIGIVFLVFTIMYFSPGDPANLYWAIAHRRSRWQP